ncbi:MAG: YbjN domain-containing protein [Clostridia bacterium]|nr:YbjN domain-containing protein [Clostridia bacterium]
MSKAREIYDFIVKTLNDRDWNFDKDDEKMIIQSGIKGEDFPIRFLLIVNDRNEVIQFVSSLPFQMPEDMRVDGAIAVAVANYGMVDGCFDYDLNDGEIRFRLTTAFRDGTIGPDLVEYIIGVSAAMVEKYNDRFFMLAKKMMTIEQFIEKENE